MAPAVAASLLPASVAEQIRKAQVRAALLGQAPAAWAVGCKCQAMYNADGKFYGTHVMCSVVPGCLHHPDKLPHSLSQLLKPAMRTMP